MKRLAGIYALIGILLLACSSGEVSNLDPKPTVSDLVTPVATEASNISDNTPRSEPNSEPIEAGSSERTTVIAKIPDSSGTVLEINESTYDVFCIDEVLGKKLTDDIVYSRGQPPTAEQIDKIQQCKIVIADDGGKIDDISGDQDDSGGHQSRDQDDSGDQSYRGQEDDVDGDFRNDMSDGEVVCRDQDESGLPLGPQCNVNPAPLPDGVTRARLLDVSLPDAAYKPAVEGCQVFQGEVCSELRWEPVQDVRAGEFTALEIFSKDPNIMYAGVDSNDMTMYRSLDAGASWQLVHVTGHNAGIAVSPVDPDIALYTNLEWAVQLTLDRGETWKSVLGGTPETGDAVLPFTAIAFSDTQPHIVYAAALRYGDSRGGHWPGEPSDIYRSADSGRTWKKVGTCETCSAVQTIAVKQGDPEFIWLAADGGVQFSKDGGRTWSGSLISYLDQQAQKNFNAREPPKVIGLALQPGNPDVILAASSDHGMFRSTDSGETWSRTNSGLTTHKLHRVSFAASNPNVAYLSTHKGVFRSNDAGQSWIIKSQGLLDRHVSPLAIHPTNEDIVYVGTSSEIYTIHPRHKRRGLIEGGGLYKTVDGGDSWIRSDNGIYEAKISQMGTHPLFPFNIWVGGESGRGNFFSPDGGSTWSFSASITAHYPMVYAFSYDIPSVIYTTGWLRTGELTASTDGGASWYTMTHKLNEGLSNTTKELGLRKEGPSDFHIHGIAVAPSDSNVIYVGSVHDSVYPDLTFNLDGAHIFKSSDGGQSFPEMSNGFPIETKTSINAIVVHPTDPDIAYAMTSLHESETAIGIYKTIDGAKFWSPVNNGLDVYTNDLQMDPINPDVLYVASESGVYKTTDGAQNWDKASNGIPKGPVIDMAIDPLNPLVLYAITADDIYRTRDGAAHWYPTNLGLPLLEASSAPLSAQERLMGQLTLDRTKTGHSEYGGTFAQDRTLEIDATGRVLVVAVKTHRNDRNVKAERLLYRAILTPLVNSNYEFEVDSANVKVTSQSYIYDMVFDSNNGELAFVAAGPLGTESRTSLHIPSALLMGEYQVLIDNKEVASRIEGNRLSFEYIHTGRNHVIIRTT